MYLLLLVVGTAVIVNQSVAIAAEMHPTLIYFVAIAAMVYFQMQDLTDARVWLCAGVALGASVWEGLVMWQEVYGREFGHEAEF